MDDEKLIYDTWGGDPITITGNKEVNLLCMPDSIIDMNDGFTGKVVDDNGDPVEGATVKVFSRGFGPLKHTVTNEQGDFFIEFDSTEEVHIYAVKDGYIMSEGISTNWAAGIVILEDIVITPSVDNTCICFGKVLDENDVPVENMYIYLRQDGVVKYTARSNNLGEINIYKINPGTYEVFGASKTHTIEPTENIEFVEGETKFVKFKTVPFYSGNIKGTISGEVYSDDPSTNTSGALISLFKIEDSNEIFVAKTYSDTNGRFFFGNVEEGSYLVKSTIIIPYN